MIMLMCTAISLVSVKQIKSHTKSLMQVILLIENIKILIEYKNISITEIFNIVLSSENYNLLFFLVEIKKGLNDYHSTLKNVFEDKKLFNNFDDEDVEYLKGFFSMLGTSDTDGQIVNCNLYKKLFEKKHSQLVSVEKSKCKCTTTLSIGIGLLISIIII